MGHVCLAPFTSQINAATGKRRPALHLQGPSGCGKLYLGTLAMSFFGTFHEGAMSWSSTPNAIEQEGHCFRDALFLVDDFKLGLDHVPPKVFCSVVQKYADSAARSRLTPNATMGPVTAIRGLFLSTGEDFVNTESVSARTILIRVERDINKKDGDVCWETRDRYRSFLPALVQMVISQPGWQSTFRRLVTAYTDVFLREIAGRLSNGLRMASNWALNTWGFHQFAAMLMNLGVITRRTAGQMLEEYQALAVQNLREHADRLGQENPVSVFLEALGERIAAGEAYVDGLPGAPRTGPQVGVAKPQDGSVYIFCNEAIAEATKQLRPAGRTCPPWNSLRDALAGENLIRQGKPGRWTVQVRLGKKIRQAWKLGLGEFTARCGLEWGGDE